MFTIPGQGGGGQGEGYNLTDFIYFYLLHIARPSPKHIATPKKLLVKNAFILKIFAISLQNSRAFGADI